MLIISLGTTGPIELNENDRFIAFINRYNSNSRQNGSSDDYVDEEVEHTNVNRGPYYLRNKLMMQDSTSFEDSRTEYLAESEMKSEQNLSRQMRHEDVSHLLNVLGSKVELTNHSRENPLDMSKTLNKSLRKLSINPRRTSANHEPIKSN